MTASAGATLCEVVKEGLSKDVPGQESQPSGDVGELPGRGNIKAVSEAAAGWPHWQ